jgi:hypothetical protein
MLLLALVNVISIVMIFCGVPATSRLADANGLFRLSFLALAALAMLAASPVPFLQEESPASI